MLRVLLESRAKGQRRSGGAMASVVVHVAIISAAVVGTVQGRPAPPPKVTIIPITAPTPPRKVIADPAPPVQGRTITLPPGVVIRHVEAPTFVPPTLPPIDMTAGMAADTTIIGSIGDRNGRRGPVTVIDGERRGGSSEWSVSEVLMNVLSSAKPRYPESLRNAGVDGHVLVQFTVDTTGRVDMNSVKVLSSTHDLFSRAVRDALGTFRFRPAEVGGKRVAALAQMPFEFQITK